MTTTVGRDRAACAPTWRGGDVAVLTAAGIMLPALLGIAVRAAAGWAEEAALLATPVGMALVVLLARRRGLSAAHLGLRLPRSRWLVRTLGLGLGLVAVNVVLGLALRAIGAGWAAGQQPGGPGLAGIDVAALAAALLLAAVVVPVEEELLFRGILQGGLTARFGPAVALPVAAVAFLLAHGPQMGAFHLVAGVAYGLVAHRSGSILPAVVLHAVNNAVVVVLLALPASG